MSKRAEFRRLKNQIKKSSTFNPRSYSRLLTDEEIEKIKKDAEQDAMDKAFMMMLSIPSYVLSENDWKKTSDKRIPPFVDKCLEIYEDVVSGKRSFTELIEYIERKGKISIINK